MKCNVWKTGALREIFFFFLDEGNKILALSFELKLNFWRIISTSFDIDKFFESDDQWKIRY